MRTYSNRCVPVDKLTTEVDNYFIIEDYLIRKSKAFTFEIGANHTKIIKFSAIPPTKVERMLAALELIHDELDEKIKAMQQQISQLEKDAVQLKFAKRTVNISERNLSYFRKKHYLA
jgi:hypothetical protein